MRLDDGAVHTGRGRQLAMALVDMNLVSFRCMCPDHAAAGREPGGWQLSPARRTPLVLHALTDNRRCCYRVDLQFGLASFATLLFLHMWFEPWISQGSFQKNFMYSMFLIELYVVSLLSNRFKIKPVNWDPPDWWDLHNNKWMVKRPRPKREICCKKAKPKNQIDYKRLMPKRQTDPKRLNLRRQMDQKRPRPIERKGRY